MTILTGEPIEVISSNAWCEAKVLRVYPKSAKIVFNYGGTWLRGKVLADRQPRKLFRNGVYYFSALTDVRPMQTAPEPH